MKKIISIQHCESIHHTNGMIGSWTDWDLSENGIKQAHNIGKKMKEEGGYEDYIIYSSDLKRAYQTASIVGNYINKKPIIKESLRERNLGSACGKSSKWFKENANLKWGVDNKVLEDAETVREHYNRVKEFYNEIIENNEEKIIFVSHGGTASVFNTMFLKQEADYMDEVNIHSKAGSISKYRVEKDVRFVECVGDLSYRDYK